MTILSFVSGPSLIISNTENIFLFASEFFEKSWRNVSSVVCGIVINRFREPHFSVLLQKVNPLACMADMQSLSETFLQDSFKLTENLYRHAFWVYSVLHGNPCCSVQYVTTLYEVVWKGLTQNKIKLSKYQSVIMVKLGNYHDKFMTLP